MSAFETFHSPSNQPRTFHSVHETLPFPDLDASPDVVLVSPHGVDYDFDPDYAQAERDAVLLAWASMIRRSEERRTLAS